MLLDIFDGLAKLTRYEISNSSVKFNTKFIRSNFYHEIVDKGGDIPEAVITLGPVYPKDDFICSKVIRKIKGILSLNSFDNVPVNVHEIGGCSGKFVGVTDAPLMIEFDIETLDTIGKVKFKNDVTPSGSIEILSTAHAHNRKSKIDDQIYSYNYHLNLKSFPKPTYIATIVRTDKDLNRVLVGSQEMDTIPYIHDFSLTDNYLILTVWPMETNISTLMQNSVLLSQLNFNQTKSTKIFVFDIKKFDQFSVHDKLIATELQPIASFEAPAMFAYHHINSFEVYDTENNIDKITFDVTGYKSGKIANGEVSCIVY